MMIVDDSYIRSNKRQAGKKYLEIVVYNDRIDVLLMLCLAQENPPVVQTSRQKPLRIFGKVKGYRLRFLVKGSQDSDMVEVTWENELYTFSSGFLGIDTPYS